MTKVLFLFSLIALLLSSCIGERLECSESHYNVKNQLKDSIFVIYSTAKYELDKNNGYIITSGDTKMMFNYSYKCTDFGGKIKEGTAEGGFVNLKNCINDYRLVIFSMSGDTLADFSPTSSIYDRENWELSMDEKYNVDCTLILTEDLIKTARP